MTDDWHGWKLKVRLVKFIQVTHTQKKGSLVLPRSDGKISFEVTFSEINVFTVQISFKAASLFLTN